MWESKIVLKEGETLRHEASRTSGFMAETDIDTYSIVGADGKESGVVSVEDHTAVKGGRRTITVVQKDSSGKEVVRTSFNPKGE